MLHYNVLHPPLYYMMTNMYVNVMERLLETQCFQYIRDFPWVVLGFLARKIIYKIVPNKASDKNPRKVAL